MANAHTPNIQLRRMGAQRGMSLIEVLVAFVIFAVGLLGTGGLMLSSLRSGQYASSASVAMGLARDYGELMQVIPPSVISTSGGTSTFMIDTASGLATPADCKGTSSTCTPQQMIQFGVYEWAKRVEATLPAGRAVVCRDSSPKQASGLYRWNCDDAGDLMVVKFGWLSKAAAAASGAGPIEAAYEQDLPKLTIVLFGNQKEFVTP